MRLPKHLNETEQKFLEVVAEGKPFDCSTGDREKDNAASGISWGEERTIRAEIIRAVCVGGMRTTPLDPKGICIKGARIAGTLDLEDVTVATPLRLLDCHFGNQVNLRYARLKLLDLGGSFSAYGIDCCRIFIEHDALLRGVAATAGVDFEGAEIGGVLNCSGSNLDNAAGYALNAQGISVKGGVFLGTVVSNKRVLAQFIAKGEVRLLGARIHGQLNCGGGRFENPTGYALNADGMFVKDDVYLRTRDQSCLLTQFIAKGEVRLPGADIGGQLDGSGGRFENPNGVAFFADGVRIGGGLFLREIVAHGEVRVVGADIRGTFDCTAGYFENSAGHAINGGGISVHGSVHLRTFAGSQDHPPAQFRAKGMVSLLGAKIEGQLNCAGGSFGSSEGPAFIADGASVKRGVFLCAVETDESQPVVPFIAQGEVRLHSAEIGRQLNCSGGRFENPDSIALTTDGASIKGSVHLGALFGRGGQLLARFTAKGEVRVLHAEISGNLDCTGGDFQNPGRDALVAEGAIIKRNVYFRTVERKDGHPPAQFIAKGQVRLPNAEIAGQLDCRGGRFTNARNYALNADGASIRGGVLLGAQLGSEGEFLEPFTAQGGVRMLHAEITGPLDCRGGHFENAEGLALCADGIKVRGDVLLSTLVSDNFGRVAQFTAEGEVRLLGARIDGQLNCNGGCFENPSRVALKADAMSVTGSVFLGTIQDEEGRVLSNFSAVGEARPLGAKIGGQLACVGGQFENSNGRAFSADGISVGDGVYLRSARDLKGQLLVPFKARGDVRFPGADMGGRLDLRGACLDGSVNLEEAIVHALVDDPESWPRNGQVELDGFRYERFGRDAPTGVDLRLEWLQRQPGFRMQPYEQLIRVLRALGREKDARKVAIQKQVDLRESGHLGFWLRVWNLILGFFVGHGYKPGRAAWFAILVIAAGACVFYSAEQDGAIEPSTVGVKAYALPSNYPRFNPVVYSLDVFLPIVDLHQEDYWLPDNAPTAGWFYWIYMWLHISLGWILTTFIVAAVTGLIRKD